MTLSVTDPDPISPTAELRRPVSGAPNAIEALAERLAEDMSRRWRDGERPLADEYLELYPELQDHPEAAADLIYEEICLRRQVGGAATTAQVLERFPQWRRQLELLLECQRILEPAVPQFPNIGDNVAGFRLLAELGRGAQGRAYLAAESALGERHVVLKCVPPTSSEHLSLARLQHTHIMPLYAVQEDADRGLRVLVMPYFGGMTLARLLELLRARPQQQRTGGHLAEAFRENQANSASALPVQGPVWQLVAGATYVQAICWMAACLADALQFADEHGLLHLDVKPSNILWAADGQPMLLDFHLARAPLPANASPPAWLGGTPAYMAPEQRRAVMAVHEGHNIPDAIDGRSDVFGLGAVLYEALGGALPLPDGSPGETLRQRNRQVSAGLADVLDKCLAANASRRYPNAAALATDLRRHLADQPLAGVGNRSLRERWSKWRRRRPYAPALLALFLAIVVIGGAVVVRGYWQRQQAVTALQEAQLHLSHQRFGEARAALKGGLALSEGLPWNDDLIHELRTNLLRAEAAQAAADLHQFVERVRALYGADIAYNAETTTVAAQCAQLWQHRATIRQRLEIPIAGEAWPPVVSDLLDLAILWSHLRVRLAPRGDMASARQRALEVLADAEAMFGASCVLARERQVHAEALALVEEAKAAHDQSIALAPRNAWEHFALGRAALEAGDLAVAATHLEAAVDRQPHDLWSNFYLGKCAFQRGQWDTAATAFSVCIALAPTSGWCYHNRAMTYEALGQSDRARHDYDRALGIDPHLAAAALNRGMLHHQLQQYPQALADLHKALELGANPAVAHYDLALVHLAAGDRTAACASLRLALQDDPDHKEARTLLSRLLGED